MGKAKVGDLIRIISTWAAFKAGSILEVYEVGINGVYVYKNGKDSRFIHHSEYEIYRKAGEEDDIGTTNLNTPNIGDIVKIVSGVLDEEHLLGKEFKVTKVKGNSVWLDGKWDDGSTLYFLEGEYEIHRKAGEEDNHNSVVAGVGPDAPIVENELGAKQSKSPYRMDLIDAKALLEIAKVHAQGAEKYGDTNWRNISIEDNLNHALVHVYAYLAGDKQDDHLSHAATRMIFALALDLANGQK